MIDWRAGMEAVNIAPVDGFTLGETYHVAEVSIVSKGERVTVIRNGGKDKRPRAAVDFVVLRLAEVYGWAEADCFRPVEKHSTDISVFTAMLNTAKEPERELAR